MAELISISEAAELMQARPDFVNQMVAKGRLDLHDGERLDKHQVLELKQLIGKLKGDGIAAMVRSAEHKPDQFES